MLSKKVMAFYIRLSAEDYDLKSSDKLESNSVANQRKLLQDYYNNNSKLHEYEIIEFCDDGYTGTNFERPHFMDMMERVRRKEIQCIVVKDLSRFGRDYLEVGGYLELILPLFGTRFISVNDSFDSNDYVGTTGGLELTLRNLINGLYSRDLSVKIKSANNTRNKRGEYWGGTAFYGYSINPKDKHKIVVDNVVSPIIIRIYEECINGSTASQIARGLNADNILSPSAYKKYKGDFYNGRILEDAPVWTASTVIRILKDERYTGKMISNKRETVGISTGKMRPIAKENWIVVEGTHEPIISEEQFKAVAEALKSRIKTVNKNTSGDRQNNLFVCGHCGRKLQKSNGIVTHLFCTKAGVVTNTPCAALHEPLEDLQGKVLKLLKVFVKTLVEQTVSLKASSVNKTFDFEKKIITAKRNLKRLQNGKLDLYEEYRREKITREKFMSIQAERQKEMDDLKDEISRLEQELEKLKTAKEQLSALKTQADNIEFLTEYQPEIVRKLVERIRVFENGRIEVDLKSDNDFVLKMMEQAIKIAG